MVGMNMMKRALDTVFAVVALIVLSPLFLVIAVLICFDSPGPVFYRGVRGGLNGVPFRIFKFRTMVTNAEKPFGDTTAFNDPRVTRIGKVIRRYKLDEIPQLFNVIKGDMSIVGPRPELLYYTERYNDEEKLILSVRPGITDFSSLEFCALDEAVGREDVDAIFEERILPRKNALRLQYVRTRSLLGDCGLILMTLSTLSRKLFRR